MQTVYACIYVCLCVVIGGGVGLTNRVSNHLEFPQKKNIVKVSQTMN